MSAELDALTDQVAATLSVEQSALTLINGISARLDAAIAASEAGDASKLTELSAELSASGASLAAAVTANTPATP